MEFTHSCEIKWGLGDMLKIDRQGFICFFFCVTSARNKNVQEYDKNSEF